jgi:hypothetical protein
MKYMAYRGLYKVLAVPIPKRLRNGRFETANRIQKWFKI